MPAADVLNTVVDETGSAATSTSSWPSLGLVSDRSGSRGIGALLTPSTYVPASEGEAHTSAYRAAVMTRNRERYLFRFVKRAFDVAFSLIVLAVALVPGLVLSLVIALQSKGSPLYVDHRVGCDGRPLGVLKFRSMVRDADDVEKYLSAEQLAQWQSERKVEDDPRITPVGRVIRRLSIDELPQFLNVLVGQMSVIGVRPIVTEELEQYGNDGELFVSMRPGITGWWQVTARNDATYETGERQKLELYYVEHASLALDAKVFFRTFGAMGNGTGC